MIKNCRRKAPHWLLSICLVSGQAIFAQESAKLSIDSCYALAKANYPLIRQFDLIAKSSEFNVSNASKAYLPQVSATGIGGYVFGGLPSFGAPGASTKETSNTQFIGIVQVNQTIWDGGATKVQKEMIRANEEVEKNSVNVALYAIRERVNQLFFGVLVIDEQLRQLDVLKQRFDISLDQVTKAKENGYSYQSDIDEVKAEILGVEQRKIEFSYARKGYIELLSYWMGKPLPEFAQLQKPSIPLQAEMNRPELALYASQRRALETQLSQIKVGNRPKLGLLGAGLLLAPGINFGRSTFSSVAIAGLSASWNTGNLYRSSNNKELQKIQLDKIQTEEETFRFNNGLQQKQASADIEKQRAVLKKDQEIIALKESIKQSYQLKYDNGISSMSELITAMNKEAEATSNQSLHEIQLLMSLYNSKTIHGN